MVNYTAMIKGVLSSLKESESGKNDVLSIRVDVVKDVGFTKAKTTRFYNMIADKGVTTAKVGDEIEINLADFDIEVSKLTYQDGSEHDSMWLKPVVD